MIGQLRIAIVAFVTLAFITLATARIVAHPAADTEVLVTLGGGTTFDLMLTTGLDALLIKLEALAGKPHDPALSDVAREGRIALLQDTLKKELELAIDTLRAQVRAELN